MYAKIFTGSCFGILITPSIRKLTLPGAIPRLGKWGNAVVFSTSKGWHWAGCLRDTFKIHLSQKNPIIWKIPLYIKGREVEIYNHPCTSSLFHHLLQLSVPNGRLQNNFQALVCRQVPRHEHETVFIQQTLLVRTDCGCLHLVHYKAPLL